MDFQWYKTELIQNAKDLYKMASAYFTTLMSAVAFYWLQLIPERQQELLSTHPILIKYGPWIALVLWVYVRIHPQKSLDQPVVVVQTNPDNRTSTD